MKPLPIDHHVHLEKGPYSFAWLDAFVGEARARGIARLGMVEHSTQFRSLSDHIARERDPGDDNAAVAQKAWMARHMNRERLDDYVDFIRRVRERHDEVAFGLEVDWVGNNNVGALSAVHDWDFLIGSVHYVDGYAVDNATLVGIWDRLPTEQVYERYFGLLCGAAESRIFDILGHLDVPKMVRPFSPECHARSLEVLIDVIATAGITVEVNTAYSYRHVAREEFCPSTDILKRLAARGVPMTLSSDAHQPDHVGCNVNKAAELLRAIGVSKVRRFWRRQAEDVPLL